MGPARKEGGCLYCNGPKRGRTRDQKFPGGCFLRIGANLKEASCLPSVPVVRYLIRADIGRGCALACQNHVSSVKHPTQTLLYSVKGQK